MQDVMHEFRVYRTAHFVVKVLAHYEDLDPADTIAWANGPDDTEGLRAEREYLESINRGDTPWYCLGVHVFTRNDDAPWLEREIGSSYLGGVDAKNPRDVGLRDVAHEAFADARSHASAVGSLRK